MNSRAIATTLFMGALEHVTVAEAIRDRVRCHDETLHVGELSYALGDFRTVVVISMGKAALSLSSAVLSSLEPELKRGQRIDAIVAGSTPPQKDDPRVRFFKGGHPTPNETSRYAAEAILQLLTSTDETCLVLFLISGGASAMVEKPLNVNVTLDDVSHFYKALVQSGLPIAKMNALRSHFSQVKGGRLAVAAQRATKCTLLISDVPENLSHVVGSGPSLPDPSTVQDCRQIIRTASSDLSFSNSLFDFFADPGLEETVKKNHPAFEKNDWCSLLSSEDLCRKAADTAERLGFHVVIDNACDDLDYRDAATYLLDRLQDLSQDHPKVCLLSAGELSVQLPGQHGIGGRNQQFVLECSRMLVERNMAGTVLSGGSDGIDGNSPAAGAVCDETTIRRAAFIGLDAIRALDTFDSFDLFEKLGDAIITGPTENNIRDLRILLSFASSAST